MINVLMTFNITVDRHFMLILPSSYNFDVSSYFSDYTYSH